MLWCTSYIFSLSFSNGSRWSLLYHHLPSQDEIHQTLQENSGTILICHLDLFRVFKNRGWFACVKINIDTYLILMNFYFPWNESSLDCNRNWILLVGKWHLNGLRKDKKPYCWSIILLIDTYSYLIYRKVAHSCAIKLK